MLGNAHEWTNDTMKGLGYGTVPLVDPWGEVKITDPKEGVVLRGGGPITPSARCRAAAHFEGGRADRGGGIGFRLVRTLLAPKDAGAPDSSASDGAPSDAGGNPPDG
jgi:formylglycine-generating enzyme required for sulfatase activity